MQNQVRRFKRLASLTLLAPIAWATAASATTITSSQGTGAANYIQYGSPDSVFRGGDVTVKYGLDGNSTNRKGYVRFDLSSVSGAINSASLQLTVDINNGGGTPTDPNPQTFTFELYGLNPGTTASGSVLGQNWSATALTWNNAPANVTAGGGNGVDTGSGNAQAVDLGSFTIDGGNGSVVTALSGSALVNFLQAAQADSYDAATFIITRTGWSGDGPNASSGNSSFYGNNGTAAQQPTLIVATPEPASLALLAPAGLLMLRRRR